MMYTESSLKKKNKDELIEIILSMQNNTCSGVSVYGTQVEWVDTSYQLCCNCALQDKCSVQMREHGGHARNIPGRPCNGFGVTTSYRGEDYEEPGYFAEV